jgi:ADP-ribose pyrophosphatase
MKLLHAFFISASCLLYAAPYDAYLEFLEKYPTPKGDYHAGEIEIVTDAAQIPAVEEAAKARLLKNGYSEAQAEAFSRVGIVMEDQYWILVRDAVIFPTGAKGTYDRLSWKSALKGPGGVAVLPVLPDGKIILNLNYRHATRSWELELPRGGIKEKESIEAAALRELAEETGLETENPIYLGSIANDTGTISSIVPIFLGKIVRAGASDQEYSEAIQGIVAFSKDELKTGLKQGYLNIDGKQVPLRDAFLTFALLQAEIRELL